MAVDGPEIPPERSLALSRSLGRQLRQPRGFPEGSEWSAVSGVVWAEDSEVPWTEQCGTATTCYTLINGTCQSPTQSSSYGETNRPRRTDRRLGSKVEERHESA